MAGGVGFAGAASGASCTGITKPVFDVALSLPVSGIMTVDHFKEGDFVHAGDVILELDEQLQKLEVDRRRLVMDYDKADWLSTKTVFDKSSSVSREELEKKETDYKVAAVAYREAVEDLRQRKLVAPAAGVITELDLHLGEACTAYQPVARLVDTRKCYFVCNIDAALSANLKKGQKVKLAVDNGTSKIDVGATIVFVSPVVDPASGLQKVKAEFNNADGRVRPGLTGTMYFN